ncbi:EthD domain-containing protein [Aggregatibacter kilianii]|uniref:EthD domain-containing protein n=1 Tax=Aggregatibacter kilianii TaxID=2025884 RepID=UPI000D658D7A|nr:EthD domain-containing protein [Aggregatibacter kilianii]
MFKIIMFVIKKASLSTAEFQALWAAHSQKVEDFKDVLNIRRYAKTFPLTDVHQLDTQRATLPFTFDAMGELWYDSKEDFVRARETEAGKYALAILREDEKRFVDLARSVMWLGEEERII